MRPRQRQDLAIQAFAQTETIRGLAAQHAVSRKFIYRQVDTAKEALQEAFVPEQDDATKVLFHLPVTKLSLSRRSSASLDLPQSPSRLRSSGICLACPVSAAGPRFSNRLCEPALTIDKTYHASLFEALDDIFQSGQPVLVGANVRSTYCYLLNLEQHRDAETWGIRLLELQDRGFHPEATIADAGSGSRAVQALACRNLLPRRFLAAWLVPGRRSRSSQPGRPRRGGQARPKTALMPRAGNACTARHQQPREGKRQGPAGVPVRDSVVSWSPVRPGLAGMGLRDGPIFAAGKNLGGA